jgi:ParB-like chromosome segregation protein Spo0J
MMESQKRILRYVSILELKRDPRNPRQHKRPQIEAIAKSIEAFGFNAPILIDKNGHIIAGHGRYEASILLELSVVPVVSLDDLTAAQTRAYMLADNRLTDRSSWDERMLAVHLRELSELALEFNIEATGFELPEIDLRIQSLEDMPDSDEADEFAVADGQPVSQPGDLWLLGDHRLLCGDALDEDSYKTLFGDRDGV